MARIKSRIKDNKLYVRISVSWSETLNKGELESLSRKTIRGFFTPVTIKKHRAVYSGPMSISLRQYLRSPITDYDFLFLIEQIVDATRRFQKNTIPWDRVIWNPDSVFINRTTREVRFLYVPLEGVRQQSRIYEFLDDIVYSARMADGTSHLVTDFAYFLHSLKNYDFDRIEAYIAKNNSSIVEMITRSGGKSGFITDKQREYYKHYADSNDLGTDLLADDSETGLLPGQGAGQAYQAPFDDSATGLMDEYQQYGTAPQPDAADLETGLLDDRQSFRAAPQPDAADLETGLLDDRQPFRAAPQPDAADLETGLLHEEPAANFGYEEFEERTFALKGSRAVYPTLLRVRTGETILVNKPVFRLGKERSYVDYFVSSNDAVSRSHADIITRGQKYYIKDLNSTNRTYINNKPIVADCEMEIVNNDRIKLGNEEFVFHS